ncbi:MAG: hypothetical protein QOK10_1992 [Pseudonocardiales bacterium]|jgi:hypothetical protein|nr:hypothetical protein [Pseudonocardiales bacterium]
MTEPALKVLEAALKVIEPASLGSHAVHIYLLMG